MPWVRIDENALEHPKVAGLSDGAFRLWVRGLAHCQKFLTDGVITNVAWRGFYGASAKRIGELVKAGLWRRDGDRYLVHDYLKWNESRERVLELRDAAKQRMRRSRSREHPTNVLERTSREVLRGVREVRDPEGGTGETSAALFERLYTAYPNKARRALAEQVWATLHPTAELAAVILRDVERRTQNGWARCEPRFVPQLRNYLEERQWEEAEPAESAPADDPYAHFPRAWTCGKCGGVHEGTPEQFRQRLCLAEVAVKA